MKSKYQFLEKNTKRSIEILISSIAMNSLSKSRLLEMGFSLNVQVISCDDAITLINNMPLIIAHQVIEKKLKVRPLLDPYEVGRFEEMQHYPEDIVNYIQQFELNSYDKDLIIKIGLKLSKPLKKQNPSRSTKFIVTSSLISDPMLYRAIALATNDVWGYNTFAGLFHDLEILDHMSKMDLAINLQNYKSIIPVRVFSDFVEVTECLEIIESINESCITRTPVLVHGVDKDLEIVLDELQDYVGHFVCKYRFLESTESKSIGKSLLGFFTMSPKEMIKLFGPNVVCCPFAIPPKLESEKVKPEDREYANVRVGEMLHYRELAW